MIKNLISGRDKPIGRFRMLLLVMVLMMGFRPFLDGFVAVSFVADVFVAATFISGVYALSKEKRPLISGLILALGSVITRFAQHFADLQWLNFLNDGIVLLFLCQMLVIITLHIKQETEVTSDLIVGAVCGFLLMGFIWAYGYHLLELVHQNSFKGEISLKDSMWSFIYYSFITLTTVGFGDITPVTDQARALSILEATCGQLYLAILIAELVGLHTIRVRN